VITLIAAALSKETFGKDLNFMEGEQVVPAP
jgi:hypothetical protein